MVLLCTEFKKIIIVKYIYKKTITSYVLGDELRNCKKIKIKIKK